MKRELEEFLEVHGIRHYVVALKKNTSLTERIKVATGFLPDDAELSERVWSIINEKNEAICYLGNRKNFNTINKGYKFCKKYCQCYVENQANKLTEYHQEKTDDEIITTNTRIKKSIQNRYGVDNAAKIKNKSIIEKTKIHCEITPRIIQPLFSSPFDDFRLFFEANGVDYRLTNGVFIIPHYNVAIQICLLMNETYKTIFDNLNELKKHQERGFRLITIFEDEIINKREIVFARLKHLLQLSEKGIGARQLIIETIPWKQAKLFLDKHHIQGAGSAGYVRYAAYDGGEIVACMTFSKPRICVGRSSGADELLRFATNGKNYPGIASRLFARYIKEYNPDAIISYADKRWSEGNLYEKLGFKFVSESRPSYFYYDQKNLIRHNRFEFTKGRIINMVENGSTKSEREIMIELGYLRIYDCGALKYEWKSTNNDISYKIPSG